MNGVADMADRPRVLVTDRAWPDLDLEREILANVGAVLIDAPDDRESTLIELARDVDAIATCWAQVTPAIIRASPDLKVVARFGIGLDNICVKTASELGIPVTYVPDYCVSEVADHALALVLCSVRKVAFFHLRTKQGEYDLQAGPGLRRLSSLTLGLLGFGRIARDVYHKARGLGMNVVAHSESGRTYGTDCSMVSLDSLLDDSDVVSVHVPLNDLTVHLLGEREFARMKPSAYVVNTSRGAVIDNEALSRAISSGRLAGAALDVFDPEPPDLSDPLYRDERVVVTPHAGFLSAESLRELRTRTATQVAQALQGERPEHVVNPHVYE